MLISIGSATGRQSASAILALTASLQAGAVDVSAGPQGAMAELISPNARVVLMAPENDPAKARGAPSDRSTGAGGRTEDVVHALIVAELVEWIGRRTTYDVSKTRANPPAVTLASEGARIAYEGRWLDLGDRLKATYDVYARSIHLKRPWSATDVHDLSTLLHELVHDVQYRNRHWPCPREAEWEAYHLQADWLAERGEEMTFNWLAGALLSGCGRDVHP